MTTAMIAAAMISNVQMEIRREHACIGSSHFSANATILSVSQGDGNPKETSKKFEATLEETATSPSPC